MRVRDLMRSSPWFCDRRTHLAATAETPGCGEFGALTVVDGNRQVVGIITDRDIGGARRTRNRRPSQVRAEQARSHPAVTRKTSDEIEDALNMMHNRSVRRLPVVGDSGKLEGTLSLSDLILQARDDDGSHPELTCQDVLRGLKSIDGVDPFSCGAETATACRT